jgi:molybdopterin converting factor small subunit
MAKVHLPEPLRALAGGEGALEAAGAAVGEVLKALGRSRPQVGEALWADARRLRAGVVVYLGRANVRALAGLETAVGDEAELYVVAPLLVG